MSKPNIKQHADGKTWDVAFPCGGSAVIREEGNGKGHGYGSFLWESERANGEEPSRLPRRLQMHGSMTLDGAIRLAWGEVRPSPRPTAYQVRDFADCEQLDGTQYTKLLRKILKIRTGRTWSVKVGRGTAYSWIDVTSPPARQEGYYMSADDESLLSAVLNEATGQQHVSIPPTSGFRHSYLLRAAGLPIDTVTLAEHAWD